MKPNPYAKDGFDLVARPDGVFLLTVPAGGERAEQVTLALTWTDLDRIGWLSAARDLSPILDG